MKARTRQLSVLSDDDDDGGGGGGDDGDDDDDDDGGGVVVDIIFYDEPSHLCYITLQCLQYFISKQRSQPSTLFYTHTLFLFSVNRALSSVCLFDSYPNSLLESIPENKLLFHALVQGSPMYLYPCNSVITPNLSTPEHDLIC